MVRATPTSILTPRGMYHEFDRVILAGVSQLVITTAFAAPDNAVIRANAAAGAAAIKACIAPLSDPFHESRAYAMMHLAIHDALNAIDRKYQPYAYPEQTAGSRRYEALKAAASPARSPPNAGSVAGPSA